MWTQKSNVNGKKKLIKILFYMENCSIWMLIEMLCEN